MNNRQHTGGGGEKGRGGSLADRLRRLDERLDRKQEARIASGRRQSGTAGFGYAMRLSTEFVAAILVGAALGWGIDRLVGSAPWGMIVFLMLGFCAGVLNVMRTAGKIAGPHSESAELSAETGKNRTGTAERDDRKGNSVGD